MNENQDSLESIPPKVERRLARVLLSFLTPGLGHMSIGHWKRGALWFGLHLAGLGFAFLLTACAMPLLMWAAIAGCVLDQAFFTPRDALRLEIARLPKWRYVAVLAISVVFLMDALRGGVRRHLIEAFTIPGGSMYPALEVGDHFMTGKASRDFKRGDIVVFRYPVDQKISYVKRIVAAGNDTIELKAGQVILNGAPVTTQPTQEHCARRGSSSACSLWRETLGDHSYLTVRDDAEHGDDFGPRTVPPGSYFMLGDDRNNSNDSRIWGTLPEELIVGKALFTFWASDASGIRWDRINKAIE